MKNHYQFNLRLIVLTGILLFSGQNYAFSQTDETISTDPAEYFDQNWPYLSERPVFFTYRDALTSSEMHILDTLTNAERQLIEEAYDPIAIGVVRELAQPIIFNLSYADIPEQGEVSKFGGRLGRINPDTLVYTTYIRSTKANELRVFFENGYFPYGVRVNIFSGERYAFSQSELWGELSEYGFYTTSVDDDNIYIQVVMPIFSIREGIHFKISRITHVDHLYLDEESYRYCTQDANCSYANGFSHTDNLRRATARLSWPTGAFTVGFCSGSLINDIRDKDFQPYVLTANHCFSTQTNANNLEARFEYWSTSCNSGVVNPSHVIVNGSNLIVTNTQSDITLVLLKRQPGGNRIYLGWTTTAPANNATLHSTHHPAGTLMKYSSHQNKASPAYTCNGLPTSYFYYTVGLGGRTAGGSSGGPSVNQDGRIIGQLFGKCPDGDYDHCDYSAFYNVWGKFSVSYANNNLQYWLYTALGGAGVAMSTIPAATLNYGTVNLGSSKNLTVTVTNTGTRPNYLNLEASNATISGTHANQFSITSPTSIYLAPGESGTFTVRFTPTTGGAKTAQLNIPHNADNITSPRVITLNGTGGGTAGLWTGTISTNWHTSGNWSDNIVPNAATDVLITSSAPNQPVINSWAICRDLVLQNGATLTHNSSYLDVYGTFDPAFGQYTMTSNTAYLWFVGANNASWWNDFGNDVYTNVRIDKSSADAIITLRHNITCSGWFHIAKGRFQLSDNRTLTVSSSSASAFQVADGGTLILSAGRALSVTGGILFYDGSRVEVTGGAISCGGNFRVNYNTMYNIALTNATLTMNGDANQYIQDFDAGALQLHNLTINKSGGSVFIAQADLVINGNLYIVNGTLSAYDAPIPVTTHDILIKGNWTNSNFPDGFVSGSGRVTFNGPGHQYVFSSENFNTLVADMGAALRINNAAHTVTCNNYDWKKGGIDVIAGTFTANNLVQNGIYGGYWLNPGGVINLTNAGGWIDLNGHLNIFGGSFNVYGGTTSSYWPWAANASINMNGGVLDFKDQGIIIHHNLTYSLTENITGGTIRTSRGLMGNRADFNPNAGTFEFYGSGDYLISQENGCTLHNIKINKSAKEGSEKNSTNKVYDERSGLLLSEGGKANTLTLSSNFTITGNLDIEAGTLNAADKHFYIGGEWTNNVGASGFIKGTSNVSFNGPHQAKIHTAETFHNMTLDKTYTAFDGLEIMSVPVTVLNNLTIIDGTLEVNSNSVLTVGNTISIAAGAGLNVGGYDENIEVYVGGHYINHNTGYDTVFGYTPGGETITFNGAGDQFINIAAATEDFGNLIINKPSGLVRPNSNIQVLGDFEIISGSFSRQMTGLTYTFLGDFTIGSTGSYLPGTPSITVFAGEKDQDYFRTPGGAAQFGNIIVDKNIVKQPPRSIPEGGEELKKRENDSNSIGMTLNLHSSVVAFNGGTTTIENGTLQLNGVSLKSTGDYNINAGAALRASAGSSISIVNGLFVNDGGVLELFGTPGNNVLVHKDVAGLYQFEINSGGTIRASHTTFQDMNATGLHLKPGAIVDVTHSFHHCTFRHGAPAPGALLTLDNNQIFTVIEAVFPANTWGGQHNVRKSANTGHVTFDNATGDFAGSAYEDDIYKRIDWIQQGTGCKYTIALHDDFGDGWNDGMLRVKVNGVIILNSITLLQGFGPQFYSFYASTGDLVEFIYTPGSWAYENYYHVYDYNDDLVFSDGLGGANPSGGSLTADCGDTPPAPYLVGEPLTRTVGPSAGTTIFDISSNITWMVAESIDWLSVSPMWGSDDGTIVITYDCNTAATERSGLITVSGDDVTDIVLSVVQEGTGEIPVNRLVTDETVGNGDSGCYDALQTITVQSFLVESGGIANLIAGENIIMLTGTYAKAGSYLHAHITTTSDFCGSTISMLAAEELDKSAAQNEMPLMDQLPDYENDRTLFCVFPNPTKGMFTLKLTKTLSDQTLSMEIYTLVGERVISEQLFGDVQHQFDLTFRTKGIYIVRVTVGDQVQIEKLVKH